MAATPQDVRSINGSEATDETIQPYLDAAACLLDQVQYCTAQYGISDTCLDTAQAYLASHLMALSAPHQDTLPTRRETFENYTVERLVSTFDGQGVIATSYGQAANGLTGGCLQEVDKRQLVVSFFG